MVKFKARIAMENVARVVYEFTIEDNGVGMEPEFIDHIFEPFVQEAMDVRSSYQGTGLGMTITKSILDLMDGNIRVESRKMPEAHLLSRFLLRRSHVMSLKEICRKGQCSRM